MDASADWVLVSAVEAPAVAYAAHREGLMEIVFFWDELRFILQEISKSKIKVNTKNAVFIKTWPA